ARSRARRAVLHAPRAAVARARHRRGPSGGRPHPGRARGRLPGRAILRPSRRRARRGPVATGRRRSGARLTGAHRSPRAGGRSAARIIVGMANLVTLSRLVLLLVVVWLAYQPISAWHFASFFLIILIFVTDGLDGYIARKRNEASLFGALFDIAGDRVVELTL